MPDDEDAKDARALADQINRPLTHEEKIELVEELARAGFIDASDFLTICRSGDLGLSKKWRS